MKSAFELAMEKLGGTTLYTDAQKAALADIGSRYQAKRAELTLAAEDRLRAAARDSAKIGEIRDRLAHELKKIDAKEEAEKTAIRGK